MPLIAYINRKFSAGSMKLIDLANGIIQCSDRWDEVVDMLV